MFFNKSNQKIVDMAYRLLSQISMDLNGDFVKKT